MESILININSENDRNLLLSLAKRLKLTSKVFTDEEKEDYGLLHAILDADSDDFVDEADIMKHLSR